MVVIIAMYFKTGKLSITELKLHHKLLILLVGLVFVPLITFYLLLQYQYNYSFSDLPKYSHTSSGKNADPINLLFIGSKSDIISVFSRAGWLVPDPINIETIRHTISANLLNKPYPTEPVSDQFLYGRIQDLSFEKPSNTAQNRDHLRIWKSDMTIDGVSVWIASSTYDKGIKFASNIHLSTHHILPMVDKERQFIGTEISRVESNTGFGENLLQYSSPRFIDFNADHDYYLTDGDILVIKLQNVLSVSDYTDPVYELKNDIFGAYNDLLEIFGFLLNTKRSIGSLGLGINNLCPASFICI